MPRPVPRLGIEWPALGTKGDLVIICSCMSQQKTQSVANDLARAAELIEQLNLVRTLDDIPCEHVPRTASRHSSSSVRATLAADMVKDADIGVDGAYQPMLYAGGAPLVVDEPCVILRPHPHNEHE